MWEKLEKYLNEKEITMYQLSKNTDIPEATINNIKHKRIKSISFHAAYKIAKALEINLEELVPDEWKEAE